MPKNSNLRAEKIYEITDYEKEGILFISEYYLKGGKIDYGETRVSRYSFNISPDQTIHHTIVREGHNLKNIILIVDEGKQAASEES